MTSILLISPRFPGFRCTVSAFSALLLNDFGVHFHKDAEVVNGF